MTPDDLVGVASNERPLAFAGRFVAGSLVVIWPDSGVWKQRAETLKNDNEKTMGCRQGIFAGTAVKAGSRHPLNGIAISLQVNNIDLLLKRSPKNVVLLEFQ